MKTHARKTLSFLLCLVLILGLFPTAAFADSGYAVAVVPEKTTVAAGETVTLTAAVTKNGETLALGDDYYLWWWTDTWADGRSNGNSDAAYSEYDYNSGKSLSAKVTVPTEGTYYIAAELKDSSSRLSIAYTTITVTAKPSEAKEIALPNGDFENGTDGWTLAGYTSVAADSNAQNNKTNTLNLWLSNDDNASGSASYSTSLTAGEYYFTFDLSGDANLNSGLSYSIVSGDTELAKGTQTYSTTGWDQWATHETEHFSLTEDTAVTFSISGTQPAGYWGNLDNLKLYGTGNIAAKPAEIPDPVKAGIHVPYVAGTSDEDGFIRGADVSSLLSILNSGARFKGWDVNSLGDTAEAQGNAFMKLLKDSGFNWIRLRVWNEPFNASKNGYGGGNNDVEAAKVMGKWASDAGLRVLIDFHYSDFWADPAKQQVPKSWKGKTVDEKAALINSFTKDSLSSLINAGVDVGMVQVGNETINAICGESSWPNMAKLFSAGAAGVREVSSSQQKPILVAVHFTNPERSGNYAALAKNLHDNNVDYDVFASSYYPYWHGTLDNLTSVLKNVADTYGKKVMVAETSWATTLDDGDGHANTVRVGENDTGNSYPFSVQGQATEVASVAQAITRIGEKGVGVFYWENAWIPVQYTYGADGSLDSAKLASNKAKWEQYGSGWAASFAGEYDAEDAGKWFGGSAVDNQAMFDFEGRPLESLKVFRYMQTGATAPPAIIDAENPSVTLYIGDSSAKEQLQAALAAPVTVTYNNDSTAALTPVWTNAEDVKLDTVGDYTVNGTVTDADGLTFPVTLTVAVLRENLLVNPGFESGDTGYTLSENWPGKRITKDESSNNHGGSYCLHFWSQNAFENATAQQTLALDSGTYVFTLYAQGGDVGENADTHIYVKYGGSALSDSFNLTGWHDWKTPSVTFTLTARTEVTAGVSITAGGKAWGSCDDWYLYKLRDYTQPVVPVIPSDPSDPEPDTPTEPEPVKASEVFTDVSEDSWFNDSVSFAITQGLMIGTGNGTFSPDRTASRAMMMTVIARLDGLDTSGGDTWYDKSVRWAMEQGISDGTSPNAPVTREAMVTMLWRYANSPSADLSSLDRYNDGGSISAWAREGVAWAVETGIMKGYANELTPNGRATRAQMAAVLERYCKAN